MENIDFYIFHTIFLLRLSYHLLDGSFAGNSARVAGVLAKEFKISIKDK
jgi:hypothetical protein